MTTLPNLRAEDVLSPSELQAVTGKAQAKTQAAALARLGVPFRFTGHKVIVERVVADAHDLLPKPAGSSAFRWDRIRK